MSEQAKGRALTALAGIYGVRRRWFGFEPDFLLRRRALRAIGAAFLRRSWIARML